MGAPLKKVKDLLQANTGISFLGEERSRPTGDQLLIHNKKPNGFVKKAGFSGNMACLTCLKARDDDCKVCNVCCACCTCVPRKEFAKCAHFYAAAPAEDEPWPVVPLANSMAAAAGESPSNIVDKPTYADEEDSYDAPNGAPESKEGDDWVRENLCEGCDCEFTTRQALDAHCCSEDGYAQDDSSADSGNEPTVTAVVPASGAQPMLVPI